MQTASKKKKSDWSNLPDDLLKTVLDLFADVSDYIRIAAVCKHWFSVAQFHQKQWQKSSSSSSPPMLLVGYRRSSMTYDIIQYNKDQLVLNKAKLHVPYDDSMKFRGSSHGWLIFLHYTSAPVLINPFTKATIHLPPIVRTGDEFEKFYELWEFKLYGIKKFVLSDDPSLYPDTYQVLALYSFDYVWLFRSGSDNWVHVETGHILPENMAASLKEINDDAIYYQGKFYITGKRWFVTVEADYDLSSAPRAIFRQLVLQQLQGDRYSEWQQQLERGRYSEWHKQYLVESCNGCLLYIEKSYYRDNRPPAGKTCSSFRVYKVNPNHDGSRMMCTRLQSLGGGETLFLGFSPSLSLLKSEFSGCIYYADRIVTQDNKYTEDHIGVYDIVHDIVHCEHAKRLNLGICQSSIDVVEPPIWIIPRANLNISLVAD